MSFWIKWNKIQIVLIGPFNIKKRNQFRESYFLKIKKFNYLQGFRAKKGFVTSTFQFAKLICKTPHYIKPIAAVQTVSYFYSNNYYYYYFTIVYWGFSFSLTLSISLNFILDLLTIYTRMDLIFYLPFYSAQKITVIKKIVNVCLSPRNNKKKPGKHFEIETLEKWNMN